MSELNIPESWAESTLGEVFDIISGSTPQTSNPKNYIENGIKWITPADLSRLNGIFIYGGKRDISEGGFKSCSTRLLPRNALIYSTRAPIGHIAIAGCEMCTNQGFKSLAIKELWLSKFMYYYLKSITPFIQSKGSGTTFKEVSSTVMKTIPVVLPPKGEQERIVQKIESCFEKIESTEKNLQKVEVLLEKYRESLLAKAFRGELIPQDPKDEPASVLLAKIREEREKDPKNKKVEFKPISDDEKPFELPVGWEWIRIGEAFSLKILDEHKDGNHGSSYPRSNEFVKTGAPYITAKCIDKEECLDASSFEYLTPERAAKLTIGHIKEGDVLFAHNATVGPAVLFEMKFDDAVIGTSLTCYRANPKYLDNKFLLSYIRSDLFQNQVKKVMKQATRNQVPILKQREFLIPFIPMNSQKAIADKVSSALQSFVSESKKVKSMIKNLQKLKESTLNKAFEGRLVEQIESEGTGHELLEKIMAAKCQEITQKEKPKKSVKPKTTKVKPVAKAKDKTIKKAKKK